MKKTLLILAVLLCGCFALKAQIFDCDGLRYSVLYDFIPAVKLVWCPRSFQAHDFVIPSTINHAGRTYIVMEIGEEAFAGCDKLTGSLTIGNNVSKIDDYAFAYCGALDGTLIIGESVELIGERAFERTGFTQIIFRCSSPPHLISDPFTHLIWWYDLVVPCGSLSDYENEYGWLLDIREDYVQFELTVASANPDFGSAKIDQPATCQNNGQVTVSATPAGNCMFTCWTENGEVVSFDNPYTFTLESDRNLVANFWEKKYGHF